VITGFLGALAGLQNADKKKRHNSVMGQHSNE